MRRMRLIAVIAASAALFAAPALAHEEDGDCDCHHQQPVVLNGYLNTGDFDGGVGYGTAGDGYASGYSFSYGGASASAFAGASAAAFARASASVNVSISTHFGGGFHGGMGGHGGYGGMHGGMGSMHGGSWGGHH